MRTFGTQGPVNLKDNYVVSRTDEIADFVDRVKRGKYIVLFAPRQTGKTTFFRASIDTLTPEEYFPIQLNFPDGVIEIEGLLNSFQDFIARVGFRILQVPDTPQEYVGQHLLYAYLDHFVQIVGASMLLEVQTGRGRIDLLIIHNRRKYIVETKVWEGDRYYQRGKKQLAAYLKLEDAREGYYIVFDHRNNPTPRVETETIDGLTIRSYVIPVMQEQPSSAGLTKF